MKILQKSVKITQEYFFIFFAVFYMMILSLRWANVKGTGRCFAMQIKHLFCKLLWFQHWTKIYCLNNDNKKNNSMLIAKSYRMNILMSLIKIHELNL